MRSSLSLLVLLGSLNVHAFAPIRRGEHVQASSKWTSSTYLSSSFLPSLFPSSSSSSSTSIATDNTSKLPSGSSTFTLEAESIFARCQAILATDLGVRDPSLLSEAFVYYGPYIEPLNKEEYIAAGKFFDLRQTFPDLDYRAHDFRVVGPLSKVNTVIVRCTLRTVGTMQGELRLRDEVLPPNRKRMICPPEALTMELDASSGLVVKMCSGFVMDRLVGNTRGLCNVMAAATIAGVPPSEWEIYPPAVVISRFFGRSIKQLPLESSKSLAPFPETVMIQLAKGVLMSDYGCKDLSLLQKDFSFCSPIIGPVGKESYIKMMEKVNVKELFPDFAEEFTNFRVDPFDPYRVWVDVRKKGTSVDGAKYESPSEAVSLTFDGDGFCTRLTTGAIIDPTEGNTEGLGGTLALQYSLRQISPFTARPLPQILSRSLKALLNPLTGNDSLSNIPTITIVNPVVSEQDISSKVESQTIAAPKSFSKDILPSPPKVAPVLKLNKIPLTPKDESKSTQSSIKNTSQPTASMLLSPPKVSPVISTEKFNLTKTSIKQMIDNVKVETKSMRKGPAVIATRESTIEVTKSSKVFVDKENQIKLGGQKNPKLAIKSMFEKVASEPTIGNKSSVVKVSKSPSSVESKKGVKESNITKSQSLASPMKISSTKQNKKTSSDVKLNLFNIGGEETVKPVVKTNDPPKGIPVIKQWKIGKDKTINGTIYGSKSFKDGKDVTTSVIASGMIEKGSVVTTVSGSKYFLA